MNFITDKDVYIDYGWTEERWAAKVAEGAAEFRLYEVIMEDPATKIMRMPAWTGTRPMHEGGWAFLGNAFVVPGSARPCDSLPKEDYPEPVPSPSPKKPKLKLHERFVKSQLAHRDFSSKKTYSSYP